MSGRVLVLQRSVWLAAMLFSPPVLLSQECYTWIDKTAPPGPQLYPKMIYDSSRQVTVLFGDAGDTWEWDGSSWTLKSTVGPGPRWTHAMVYDSARGVTVLYGGYGSGHPNYLSDTWEWDGSAWTLRAMTGPPPRWGFAMAYDTRRGVTVLHGGRREYDDILNDTWEWDGTNWLLRSTSGPTRAFSQMAYDDTRGVTVLFGGRETMSSVKREVWEWDGTNWMLVAADSGPWAADYPMIYDSQRQVMVLLYIEYPIAWFTAWEWDGATWTSREVPGPHARYDAALGYDSVRGLTVLFGGNLCGDLWEWDGTDWALRSGGAPSIPALAFDRQRGITLGVSTCCEVSETWQYVDNAWTMLSTIGPPLRDDPALAYDENRGVTVLFGGRHYLGDDNWANFADTWEWDGANWTQRANEGPPGRGGHRMVYDSARGVVVMFGGYVGVGSENIQMLGDTWEWDGSLWTERATTGPSPRSRHAMSYDRDRALTVLFGGAEFYPLGSIPLGDTWEWDGTLWIRRNAPGPEARYSHEMVYDALLHVTLLVGGGWHSDVGGVAYQDTWEWDGTGWLRRVLDGSPSGAAAFDSLRGVTVLFGQGETWEYSRQSPPPSAPLAEVYAPCSGDCYSTKNRYLSFAPPSIPCGAESVALRVTLGPMPGPNDCPKVPSFSSFDGVQMWVGPEVLHNGTAPTGVHELQSTPLFRNWKELPNGVIQLSDCNIVPCATYTIEAISDVHYPDGPYSAPLVLSTTPVWGDIVSHSYGPADGILDAFDVVAMVDRIKSTPGAPPQTWCDLHANRPSQGVNFNINALDIVLAVDAFKGADYPFSGPSAPGSCPGTP